MIFFIIIFKVTKVNTINHGDITEHKTLPKISKNIVKSSVFAKGKKRCGQRPKPSAGAGSKPT